MQDDSVWVDFPEINRKVAFRATHSTSLGTYFGCHCGSITGVQLTFGTGPYSGGIRTPIQVLDISTEPEISYKTDIYGYIKIPDEELTKVFDAVNKSPEKMLAVKEQSYKKVLDSLTNYSIWLMSDVVNYGSEVRNPQLTFGTIGGAGGSMTYLSRTADFVDYLIRTKTGYVQASPIVQNPIHTSKTDYSLNQAWFWIPPRSLPRTLNVAATYGADSLPSSADWANLIGQDLDLKERDFKSVTTRVFKPETFAEDSRFAKALKEA